MNSVPVTRWREARAEVTRGVWTIGRPPRSKKRPGTALVSAARLMFTEPRIRQRWHAARSPGEQAGPPIWFVAMTLWLIDVYPSAAVLDLYLCHPVLWQELVNIAYRYSSRPEDCLPEHPFRFEDLARIALGSSGMIQSCQDVTELLSHKSASSLSSYRGAFGPPQ